MSGFAKKTLPQNNGFYSLKKNVHIRHYFGALAASERTIIVLRTGV